MGHKKIIVTSVVGYHDHLNVYFSIVTMFNVKDHFRVQRVYFGPLKFQFPIINSLKLNIALHPVKSSPWP